MTQIEITCEERSDKFIMIQITHFKDIKNISHFPILMQAQIHLILCRTIQVKVIEHKEEYDDIQDSVEIFTKHFSFVRSIGYSEELKDYVLFPWNLNKMDATVFYIPIKFVEHLIE